MKFHLYRGDRTLLAILLASSIGLAAEEELSLDKITEQANPVVIHKTEEPMFSLMGRIDLTAEVNPIQKSSKDNKSELKNLHGLKVFLKIKASPKTSFFGEIANQDFYYLDYAANENQIYSLGKILVPFGDTRFFHHFYGGIQGKGGQGLLFPNVWAEPGISLQTRIGNQALLDTYIINGIKSSSGTVFPDLRSSADESRQALGLRIQSLAMDHVTLLASAYYDYYWENRSLSIVGGDFYTDYGWLSLPLRFGGGFASANAQKVDAKESLQRRGDYILVAGNGLGPGELRLRYGTFNYLTKEKSANDTHSFDLAYSFNVDVMRVMIERQWNFEGKDEVEDDVMRVMASLDF